MKKVVLVLVGGLMMMSCGETKSPYGNVESYGEGDYYVTTIQMKNGNDIVEDVKIDIVPQIIDSLQLNDSIVVYIAKQSARYADWNCNNKRTFRFNTTRLNLMYISEDGISVSVKGIASNAYGVEGDISSIVKFNFDGTMKEDEYGLPVVYSF